MPASICVGMAFLLNYKTPRVQTPLWLVWCSNNLRGSVADVWMLSCLEPTQKPCIYLKHHGAL